jgi:hypothetical protein
MKKSPGDVRQAEFTRYRLNLLAHDLLVADRARLASVREHPVVITGLHLLLQLKQALNIFLRKLNGAIGTVILRRMELASVDGALDPQLPLLNVKVRPLERQLLRADARESHEPHGLSQHVRELGDQTFQL